jgi:hypothetical protein
MSDQNPYAPPQWDAPPPEHAQNPQGFLPNGRGVDAGRGFQWISEAFELFKKNAGIWIVMFIVHMVIMWVLGLVPYVGSIVGWVLTPVFAAGYVLGCQALEESRPLEIGALFAGFNKQQGRLFAIGGFYAGGIIVAAGAFLGIGWSSFAPFFTEMVSKGMKGGEMDPAMIASIFPPLLLGGAVMMVIMIPVHMAIFYAPALVTIAGLGPGDALKSSFLAASKNVLPYIVYTLVAGVLALLALIPCGLGLLVMVPVLMAVPYTSFRDVFYEQRQF